MPSLNRANVQSDCRALLQMKPRSFRLSDHTEIWVVGRIMPGDSAAGAHTTVGGCVLGGASAMNSKVGGASMRGREVGGTKGIAASGCDEGRASTRGSGHVVALGDSLLVFVVKSVAGTELFFTLLLQRLSQRAPFLQTHENNIDIIFGVTQFA